MSISKYAHPANGNDPGLKGPLIPSRIPKPRGNSTQAWLHPWQIIAGEIQVTWATSVCCSWSRPSSKINPCIPYKIICKIKNQKTWGLWLVKDQHLSVWKSKKHEVYSRKTSRFTPSYRQALHLRPPLRKRYPKAWGNWAIDPRPELLAAPSRTQLS